jgi:hypothetical protein
MLGRDPRLPENYVTIVCPGCESRLTGFLDDDGRASASCPHCGVQFAIADGEVFIPWGDDDVPWNDEEPGW